MSTNLIIALIAICLFFSALLSGSETAITYVPREKIHQLSDSKRNNKIKKAKDDLEQTIGGILVANNFVNILMASLSTILFVNFLDGDETAGSALSTIVLLIDREADSFQAKRVGADSYLLKPLEKTKLKNLFT